MSSAYDQFRSNELDPVLCLEPLGVNESNKFDPVKLAGVLGSFGDFKDTKYRLKIRRDQVVMIQAVRFLLEQLAAESTLGKHEQCDKRYRQTTKRQKKAKDTIYETIPSTPTMQAATQKGTTVRDPTVEPVPQDTDVEAALVLQELATKQVGHSLSRVKDNVSSLKNSLTESNGKHWSFDADLHGTVLKDVIMSVWGTVACKLWYGKFEGETGRICYISGPVYEPYAYIKLVTSKDKNDIEQPYSDSTDSNAMRINIPARYLVPVLPEKPGDHVVVIRDEDDGPALKGQRWKVRAFVKDHMSRYELSDGCENNIEAKNTMAIAEVESELGRLRIPRANLAKCLPSDD
ncbi:uncharacterized protein FOMMEDRAFT_31935 [Fomitiporia mediterranea MF3/22]|uniref:uncharacterized protein n=1 Tax=Fomitiporia mediterranea (strain MF3/22) TaxID=694068 RepID=UPI0004407B78|nr:uncharacterized protein FOMMEDRAFT_31935 [Fomitiporia mediterranea MF3/22]EJC98523.1 hypothetical protein FOMMEDRAFT_31935 [Fomitiporia mediterranea MF3/22]